MLKIEDIALIGDALELQDGEWKWRCCYECTNIAGHEVTGSWLQLQLISVRGDIEEARDVAVGANWIAWRRYICLGWMYVIEQCRGAVEKPGVGQEMVRKQPELGQNSFLVSWLTWPDLTRKMTWTCIDQTVAASGLERGQALVEILEVDVLRKPTHTTGGEI